ncbi:alpha-ribazole phosphatase [Flavobacterium psychrophilum]|jgi:alpha-ribazole phosphatase|uniref:Alpha-ribazole phosphatase n=2 Tax=Flavobacterium psychrophilum TaxID=96345 RepID=A6GZK8_FLAPJ|nr:alpha-ribazole phosphatase [Flavobacterium psychrophilum]AIG30233.1 phosphoglycerate mutase [Flavobacterium psychrophilum]AIG32508.1 phosphoglycerate mutase [Flavobacterium psychrophilum]AIG34664.1 phosphoglycerate mutase [Flavobacterium psychrophilum]AIG37027.1 phosphoglycerate mutase [Flavobacterium psychrophilum]AIG39291.1 phosphoglycerate mutase [Flavobacterium psychrophilum]
MEIYLVRHTETVCEKGICYGQADVQIKPNYLSIFESIKNQIPKGAIVYSSSLKRCTILANYISSENYKTDSRLMEMNFGDWELKKWNDISLETMNPWMQDFVNVSVPNGESFIQLHKRVVSFLNDLKQSNSSNPVVIITHAGVIRSVLCQIYNLPLQDAFQYKVDFGEVKKIKL